MSKICLNFQKLTFIHDKIIVFLKAVAIKFFNTNLILGHPVSLIAISLVRIQTPFKAKKIPLRVVFQVEMNRKINALHLLHLFHIRYIWKILIKTFLKVMDKFN